MSLLTKKDIDGIKDAMEELAPWTEEPITYRTYTGTTPGDPAFGIPSTPNYDDTAETAGARDLTVEEVAVSGGAYVAGDMEFTVRRTARPAYADRIVYDGATWRPKDIGKMHLGEVLWWVVRAGKG